MTERGNLNTKTELFREARRIYWGGVRNILLFAVVASFGLHYARIPPVLELFIFLAIGILERRLVEHKINALYQRAGMQRDRS